MKTVFFCPFLHAAARSIICKCMYETNSLRVATWQKCTNSHISSKRRRKKSQLSNTDSSAMQIWQCAASSKKLNVRQCRLQNWNVYRCHRLTLTLTRHCAAGYLCLARARVTIVANDSAAIRIRVMCGSSGRWYSQYFRSVFSILVFFACACLLSFGWLETKTNIIPF